MNEILKLTIQLRGIQGYFSTVLFFFMDNTFESMPGGVLPEDLGGGVRRASGNPYHISYQNM